MSPDLTPEARAEIERLLHATLPEPEATRWRYDTILRLLGALDAARQEALDVMEHFGGHSIGCDDKRSYDHTGCTCGHDTKLAELRALARRRAGGTEDAQQATRTEEI